MTSSLALYIHFPFCLSICPYCDFDRQATGFDRIDVYLRTVEREMASYAEAGEQVHSIFVGGGTPSLMTPAQVYDLLDAAHTIFDVLPDAEITLECNPGDADLQKLRGFKAAGANRLSFGIQSLDDAFLKMLGRRHTSAEARQAATWARQAGFPFNLDFMFGLPDQSLEHWQQTLDEAVGLDPHHLSCYLLTLDERVPMGRDVARGRLVLPDDDLLAGMYAATRSRLAAAGYEQYEISNWARPGHASRHNLTYWRDGAWIGVGAGAASAYDGRRWKNTPVLERYIASVEADGQALRVEDERPDRLTQMIDHVTLGLRLREGVSLDGFAARFGDNLTEVIGETGAWLTSQAFLENGGGRLRVAAEHQLITNEILVRLEEPIAAYVRRETSASQIAAR
ncbi:MAG: radical SAM family heme chaperone HemW [Chloroflexi bacterium]|nr:MAG: radical SAM family heme chaperone HemW [Chloroflexota bacterium]